MTNGHECVVLLVASSSATTNIIATASELAFIYAKLLWLQADISALCTHSFESGTKTIKIASTNVGMTSGHKCAILVGTNGATAEERKSLYVTSSYHECDVNKIVLCVSALLAFNIYLWIRLLFNQISIGFISYLAFPYLTNCKYIAALIACRNLVIHSIYIIIKLFDFPKYAEMVEVPFQYLFSAYCALFLGRLNFKERLFPGLES